MSITPVSIKYSRTINYQLLFFDTEIPFMFILRGLRKQGYEK